MKYLKPDSLKWIFSFKRRHHSSLVEGKTSTKEEEEEGNYAKTEFGEETEQHQKPTWKCFSYKEIFDATNGFSSERLVGKGGYAEVYRGKLSINGDEIAVKRITSSSSSSSSSSDYERKEKDFLIEIGTVGHVCHPNVLSLIGCCLENGLYLIFPFHSKGSVYSLLHERNNRGVLDWQTRYKIAVGTAKGLCYLHKGCQRRIIHRDIKSSNILLNSDSQPQISDFGLAKWLPSQWTRHCIAPIEGTFGHLAPEYYKYGIVDEKTDVFAFGVFLLEIISGRKPVDSSYQTLHTWARPMLRQGEVEELVDPALQGEYDVDQLHATAFAASLCIRPSSSCRPTMIRVMEVLMEEGVVDEQDRRKTTAYQEEEEEEDGEFWGIEDLEEYDDDDYTPSFTSSSPSQLEYLSSSHPATIIQKISEKLSVAPTWR